MMELYENTLDLNFNFNSLEFGGEEEVEQGMRSTRDVIIFNNKSNINISLSGSDSGNSQDGKPQRSQANARERFRTHRFVSTKRNFFDDFLSIKKFKREKICSVNSAFNTLRLLIPTEPKNRKLSKIETLRLAKSYISHLNATLSCGE